MATTYSTLVLPDDAKLAYEVLGSYHLEHSQPIVLICGMSSTRVDFERLTQCLIRSHPVLIYDHRGIGNSSLSPAGNEEISIESLARDLLALLIHLNWKEVALCGYSMGGVIAEQMLLLPCHTVKPTSIPFRVTHLILACTRSMVTANTGLEIDAPPANITRTPEEKIAIARNVVKSLLDPTWLEENGEQFEKLLKRTMNPKISRPTEIIVKQKLALQNFNFVDLLANKFPKNIEVLVIHGRLDQVVPFHSAEETLRLIPWARFVEQGDQPGQVPTLNFGHWWYEYFDIQVWHDVVCKFLSC